MALSYGSSGEHMPELLPKRISCSSPSHRLQWNRARRRVLCRIVILVDSGLEGVSSDRVFGAQTNSERDRLFRRESIEVEDGLRRGETELLQSSGRSSRRLFLKCLQIFAEHVEARWDAEIDHDHVGSLLKNCCGL
jgi:hypothetical protein